MLSAIQILSKSTSLARVVGAADATSAEEVEVDWGGQRRGAAARAAEVGAERGARGVLVLELEGLLVAWWGLIGKVVGAVCGGFGVFVGWRRQWEETWRKTSLRDYSSHLTKYIGCYWICFFFTIHWGLKGSEVTFLRPSNHLSIFIF